MQGSKRAGYRWLAVALGVNGPHLGKSEISLLVLQPLGYFDRSGAYADRVNEREFGMLVNMWGEKPGVHTSHLSPAQFRSSCGLGSAKG